MATQQLNKLSPAPEMDYIRLLMHCVRKWYWFVLCVLLAGTAAYFYLRTQTNQYMVSSTIMIRNENQSSVPQADVVEVMGFSLSKRVADEIQIIKSHNIMEQTVRALNLQTEYRKKVGYRWVGQYPTPDVLVSYPAGYLDTIHGVIEIQIERTANEYRMKVKSKGNEESFVVSSLEYPIPTFVGELTFMEIHPLAVGDKMRMRTAKVSSVANSFLAGLSCSPVTKESNVVSISMVTDMPSRARDIIKKVIDLYNMDAVIDKNIMATNTGDFINERLAIVTLELDTVEQAVESYMKANNLSDLDKELSLTLSSQNTYNNRLFDLETQLGLLSHVEEYLREEKNEHNMIPANMGITDASLLSLIKEYNQKILERMRLSRSATDESPLFVQSDEELRALRTSIIASIGNLKQGIEISRDNVMRQDARFNSKRSDVPNKERKYMEIKRQQQIKEKLYIYLYQKREENALTLASTVMPAKIVDAPRTSANPVSPRVNRIWMIALLIGLGIPFVVLFLIDYFNDEIHDRREFQNIVKAPFLGEVLQCKSPEAVVVGNRTNSAPAELFRTIRTNMKFMLPDGKSPVILVTSALNGEGKSFVAINTAISLALLKKKVVLVGLDIRKPTLSNYLHVDFKGALTSYLSDSSVAIDELIIPAGVVDGLDVAPSGVIPPNPGELIQSPRLEDLFAELRARYDYVIVDTAPLSLVSDTYHLDKYADMTIFVTRANYISREMLPVIQEIYEQQKLHNMACVLNGVTGGKRGYGYGRYGYGRYSYGRYGYGRYGNYGYGYYGDGKN